MGFVRSNRHWLLALALAAATLLWISWTVQEVGRRVERLEGRVDLLERAGAGR